MAKDVLVAEEKKRYYPGNRRSDLRLEKGEPKKYSENRYAWVKTSNGQFVILVGTDSGESGNDIVLFSPRPGKVPDFAINLSSLTLEELEAMETLIKTAFEWARPICKLRDQEAQDAFNAGDDSITRVYRAVPQLVFRKRAEFQHNQGVLQRSKPVPEGDRGGLDSDGGVRGTGDELAEPDTVPDGAEDDGEATD